MIVLKVDTAGDFMKIAMMIMIKYPDTKT